MDVSKKLDEIVEAVGSARSMPMSASCVVNRAELLAKLEEVRAALPGSLAQAQEVLGGREQVVEEARREAERIIESAHAQRESLIADTQIARQSQEEADRILAEARAEAEEIRAEADDYVDSKLANFEVVLTKTLGSVDRGREKLLGRAPAGAMEANGLPEEGPERSADPQVLRQRADEYVDTKLGAVAAVLAKTLEAVGRGRQKLLGARPTDELGAHMAAQDAQEAAYAHGASDDDYLADLAQAQAVAVPAAPAVPPAPVAPPAAPAAQQDYYATADYQQGGYDYQQQYPQAADAYATQGGYPQSDGYGWQQQGYDTHGGYDGYQGYAQDGGYATAPDPHSGTHGQPVGHPHAPQHAPQAPAALDETSFFDTSMINLDQLREYEQGR